MAAARTAPVDRARGYIVALGGAANLAAVGACTTRLRLVVRDQAAIDEPALKALGARGLVRPSDQDLQVVVGAIADQVAREINEALLAGAPAQAPDLSIDALARALGGAFAKVEARASRVVVTLAEPHTVDETALIAAGARAAVMAAPGKVHLILGPDVERVAAGLKALVAA